MAAERLLLGVLPQKVPLPTNLGKFPLKMAVIRASGAGGFRYSTTQPDPPPRGRKCPTPVCPEYQCELLKKRSLLPVEKWLQVEIQESSPFKKFSSYLLPLI